MSGPGSPRTTRPRPWRSPGTRRHRGRRRREPPAPHRRRGGQRQGRRRRGADPGHDGRRGRGRPRRALHRANTAPGGAPVSELWLHVAAGRQDEVATALSRRPFAALETRSRAALEADARRDPLGHGTLVALAAAALAALVLAVAGLVLAIRADLRDDRGELTDLEAQGATPGLLRHVVAARAGLVAATGVLAGALAGTALAFLVTRVVSVTARADAPEPPLATTVDPLAIVLGAVLFAAAAVALVALTTRRAFADPRGPGRIGGEA